MASSRRDDLESLGYMLVFLLKGYLPWYNPHHSDSTSASDEARDCTQIKMETSIDELTHGLPEEFAKYFHDIQELEIDEEPSYFTLKNRFKMLAKRLGFATDSCAFDWNADKPTEKQASNDNSVFNNGPVCEKNEVMVVSVAATTIICQLARPAHACQLKPLPVPDLKPPHRQLYQHINFK